MRSLRMRLLAMLVAVVLVAVGTVALLTRQATQDQFFQYVTQSRSELSSAVSELGEQGAPRIVFLGPQNKVLADSAVRQVIDKKAAAAGVGGVWIEKAGAPAETSGGRVEKPVVLPASPPPLPPDAAGGRDVFMVRMGPPGEDAFLSAVNRSLLVAVAIGGAAAVLLALLFARRVVGPIEALTAAARRMEAGDLSGRVVVKGGDEVGELGRAFNGMAESLERTERLRRTLVGDVAHELRTPISNVRGYLEALRDGVAAPTPAVIDSLYDEALLLAHLVDDLQELTLAEAGQLAMDVGVVDLGEVARAAVAAASARPETVGVSLRVELADDLPLVRADARRVTQVLRNLLGNALTHTASGEVVVAARAVGGAVEVSVRDTGCGIAAEHLPHVFERFYRADRSRARATGGAGLGLAIVRELVHAHGGEVGIESMAGAGTRVWFTMPVAAAERELVPA